MKYLCKCYSQQHHVLEKTVEAANKEEARLALSREGLVALSIREDNGLRLKPAGEIKTGKFSLLLFCHELQALLKAGLSLMEAIETLHEKQQKSNTKQVTEKLVNALYEGNSFSNALESQPLHFPKLFVAMIQASEKTGELTSTLGNYVKYRAQIDFVKKKIISASIYPAILIMVGGMVILFLMLYVVPKFSALYESKSNDLPWMSELLLAWGRVLHDHAALTISVLATCVFGLILILIQKPVRNSLINKLLSIPALGEKYKMYILARFYRSTGMLLQGGIPVTSALEMTSNVLNTFMQENLKHAIRDIKDGKSISVAMEKNGLCTSVALRMLRVGERSGQMGEMMLYIGEFYDDDIARWLDWFSKLFEPILMTLIGLIVGVIVVLMYMPIFELAGSLQ
jgi:general secretion pathway protein F